MKALSLWQPWASAIALGAKRIETRGWCTLYRGPLAIHAAKRCVKSELYDLLEDERWMGALDRPIYDCTPWTWLPFGSIVAVARLTSCLGVELFRAEDLDERRSPSWAGDHSHDWCERDMGDFCPGRFGWVLTDVRAVKPIPWRGAQGLFDVPDELVR